MKNTEENMKRIAIQVMLAAATALSLHAFDSGYNTTKVLYDNAAYGQLPGEVKPPPGLQPAAQQAIQQKSADADQQSLGDIVVTARNIPETLALIPKTMEIIRIKEAGAFGGTDLKDILDDIPGAFVNRMGIGEAMASLSLRGASSRYTLIMQDGIPINDILTGGADLNMVDTSNVDKIEMVKGGMSSIYGADAVAGVVNVLTGSDEKKIATLIGGYGTCGMQKYGVASNYRIFNVDYSASVVDEKWMEYFVNSDSVKRSASAKIKFSNGVVDSGGSIHYFKREMGVPFDSYGGPSPKARQYDEDFSVGINEVANLDFMKVKIDGFMRSGDLRFKDPIAWPLPLDTKNIKKEYQASLLGIYQENSMVSVVAGYEANAKTIDGNTIGQKQTVNNAAISNASLKLFNETLLLSIGGRVDVHSQYGTYSSENISAKYKFQDGLELRAAFDKSFSAPDFGKLYWPDVVAPIDPDSLYNTYTGYIMKSNAALKVEEFTTYEAGFTKKHDNMKEAVTWFFRDSTNMFGYKDTVVDGGAAGVTITSQVVNINKASTMGLEVRFDIKPFDFWEISAQYNLLFIEDANTNTGAAYVNGGNANNKTYRLFTSFKLPNDAKLGITADYVDYKNDYRGIALEPYFLLGAKATQRLSPNLEIYLQVDNILDTKDYHVVAYMPMPGRIVTAGATLEF
jgi:outer membrane cobalamin receptor